AVSHCLDRAAAVTREVPADEALKRLEQLAPAAVAERRRATGRVDDVGEHHGREHPLGIGSMARAGQELLDLCDQLVLSGTERKRVLARKLYHPRTGNV